jgi:hypothetical protein
MARVIVTGGKTPRRSPAVRHSLCQGELPAIDPRVFDCAVDCWQIASGTALMARMLLAVILTVAFATGLGAQPPAQPASEPRERPISQPARERPLPMQPQPGHGFMPGLFIPAPREVRAEAFVRVAQPAEPLQSRAEPATTTLPRD